jgi:hypothetical protein
MGERSSRIVLAAVVFCVLGGRVVLADTHFAVISAVRTSPKTTARLNVSSHLESDATFRVYPSTGGAAASDTLPVPRETLFVSSSSSTNPAIANLFVGADAQTALVEVQLPGAISGVVLEQDSSDGKIVMAVPPRSVTAGTVFVIPVGDLRRGTSILLGNVSSLDASLTIQVGTSVEQPLDPLRGFQATAIELTRSHTLVIVRSDVPVIAQLAVDSGKTDVTMLTPAP